MMCNSMYCATYEDRAATGRKLPHSNRTARHFARMRRNLQGYAVGGRRTGRCVGSLGFRVCSLGGTCISKSAPTESARSRGPPWWNGPRFLGRSPSAVRGVSKIAGSRQQWARAPFFLPPRGSFAGIHPIYFLLGFSIP